MELVPEKLEYLFLIAVYLGLVVALLGHQVPRLLRRAGFWLSGAIFVASWTALEILGLAQGIWSYSGSRLCGVTFLTVPLEEYAVFGAIHLATTGL